MSERSLATQDYEDVGDQMEDFVTAVEDGDSQAAEETFEELTQTHAEIRRAEKVKVEQARLTMVDPTVPFERQQELAAFVKTASRTSIHRGQFYFLGENAVANRDIVDIDDLEAAAEQAVSAERELADRNQSVSGVLQDVELPPKIALSHASGPPTTTELYPEDTFEIEATVANVGDRPASEVEVVATAPDGLTLDDDDDDIGDIPGREEETASFDLTAETSGVFDVELEASSESAGTAMGTVTVQVQEASVLAPFGEDLPPFGEELPEWTVPVAGAGLVGAGAFGYFRYQDWKGNRESSDE